VKPALGDTMTVTGGRRNNVWVWKVHDDTQGGPPLVFSVTTESSAAISTNTFEPNTGCFSFWAVQGHQRVTTQLKLVETCMWPVDYLGIGDSITSGYGATTFNNGYAQKIQMMMPNSSFVILSAGNDETAEWLLRTNEMNMFQAKNTWFMGGGNDVNNSVAQATINANMQALVAALLSAPGKIFACMPTPWGNGVDMTPTATFVRTNWAGSSVGIIDMFNPLKNGFTGHQLKTIYSFDNVHENDVGYDVDAWALYSGLNQPIQ
jgi:lysophospholipase L1-like esterase